MALSFGYSEQSFSNNGIACAIFPLSYNSTACLRSGSSFGVVSDVADCAGGGVCAKGRDVSIRTAARTRSRIAISFLLQVTHKERTEFPSLPALTQEGKIGA